MSLIGIRLLAGVVALAGLVGLYRWHAESLRDEGRAEVRAEWNVANLLSERVANMEARTNALETKRRLAAQEEAQNAHQTQLNAARRDATAARAAADGLRRELASFASAEGGAACNPTPASSSTPTRIDVLADLLGDVEQAGRDMAAEADRARIAGHLCQQSYEALKP